MPNQTKQSKTRALCVMHLGSGTNGREGEDIANDQEEWRKAKTKTSFYRTRSFRKFLFIDRRTLSDFFAWLDRCTCGVSLPHHDSQGDLYSRDLR